MAPYAAGGNTVADPKKRKRKRLKAIQSFEVAGVPRGANAERFIIMKEDGSMKLDLSKLEAARAGIDKIITVCKSGTPSAEAVEALGKDLAGVTGDLQALIGMDGKVDKLGLKTRLGEITEMAKAVSNQTHDLNLQDQLDTLLTKVKEADAQIEAIPDVEIETVAAPAPAAPAPVVAAPTAEVPAAPAAPAAETPAAETPATDAAPAAPAVETAAPATTETPAAAPAEAEAETVTKADLATLGSSIVDGFKAAMGEMATVLKSAQAGGVPLATLPAGSTIEPGSNGKSAAEGEDWGNHFDLNDNS